MSEYFAWTCISAQKATHLGGNKPRGQVIINPETDTTETWYEPAAVVRKLKKLEGDKNFHPASKAELRYEIQRLCETCAQDKLADMIDRRDYSSAEAIQKLHFEGYTASVIEKVVHRAQEVGMINDGRFADVFIRSKLSLGWGARRVEFELRRRGIEAQSLPGWPYEYFDPTDEVERAFEVVQRKRIPEVNAYPKLMRFLVGRGFNAAAASDAVKRYLDNQA